MNYISNIKSFKKYSVILRNEKPIDRDDYRLFELYCKQKFAIYGYTVPVTVITTTPGVVVIAPVVAS